METSIIERLKTVHAELKEISETPELKHLQQLPFYDPDYSMCDAIDVIAQFIILYQKHRLTENLN